MKKIILALIVFTLTQACSSNSNDYNEQDADFIPYISSFTSGMISKNTTIVILFTQSVEGITATTEADKKLFTIQPNIEGDLIWINDRRLEFRPKNKLPSNQEFKVDLHLKSLFKDLPKELSVFKFQFQTIPQAFTETISVLKAKDNYNLKWQEISGSVTTADFVTAEELNNLLVVEQNDKKLPLKWSYASSSNTHTFLIDSVIRTEARGQITLKWNGKAIGADNKTTITIPIPSLKDFSVFSIQSQQNPQQKIVVNFSDPLDTKQNLNGLVYLDNGSPVRLTTNGNQLIIYPNHKIKGKVTVHIDQNIKNIMGYAMETKFQSNVGFYDYKPAVEFIGSGNISPLSNGVQVPFKAVNLSAVYVRVVQIYDQNIHQFFQVNGVDGTDELKRVGRVVFRGEIPLKSDKAIDYGQWNNFALNLDPLFKKEPGAIYRVYLSFTPKHSLYSCEDPIPFEESAFERFEENEEKYYNKPPEDRWDYYHSPSYNDRHYNWSESENPCKGMYYQKRDRVIAKNILFTDLALIAKGGQNTKETIVFVRDIKTADPVSGATIKVYDLQKNLLLSGSTNNKGEYLFESNSKQFLVVAEKSGIKSYLKINDAAALSTSTFNVGGTKTKKGIKGFIYGERGVWRPGDSLYLSFILEDKNKVLPKHHPVIMEVYTARGQFYKREVKTQHVNHVYDFSFKTNPDDPTGNWTVNINVGGNEFSKSLKIETVKPNRVKIEYDFKNDFLSSVEDNIGTLKAKWLHGAPAANLKADVEMLVQSGKTSFKNFSDYHFDDPAKYYDGESKKIFEGKLNAEGTSKIEAKIKVTKNNAPGMLQCVFKTRVFENGGDFSVDQYKIPYSPYKSYVGLKMPKGDAWNGALNSDKEQVIAISTLNEKGDKVSVKDLQVEVFELSWRWWWEGDQEDHYGAYISRQLTKRVINDVVSSVNGEARYELKFPTATWGRKYIKITHPESGHSTGFVFYTSYSSWLKDGGNMPGGAELLSFNLDKEKYEVGDEVFIKLPETQQGKALVSIETGSKIVTHFWHDLKDGPVIKFTTTPDMSPNAYVAIHLIQAYDKRENDAPLRLFGYQLLEVFNAQNQLHPVINTAASFKPNEVATISIKEEKGRKMTYTLAVVDEGLLDLTRFKTPNPFTHFYNKEGLGVFTWDMYKDIVSGLSGSFGSLLALGGSDVIKAKDGKEVQRFKPVVKFFPAKVLAKGAEDYISFTMPNYVGSVKVMVVAAQEGAYGNIEKAVPVKQALMVLPTLPRVLGPSEKIQIPVTVFAMENHVKEVAVKISVSGDVKTSGSTTQTITFNQLGNQTVYFDVNTLPTIGKGKITVEVSGNGEKAFNETDIEIRASNPSQTFVQSFDIKAKDKKTSTLVVDGLKGSNQNAIELSALPNFNLEKRLNYLIQYPHGCIEQTTSGAFPQLFLEDLMELTDEKRKQTQENIAEAIRKITQFQMSNGAFSYWMGGDYLSEWGTSYGGHFVFEAKQKGHKVPESLLNRWFSYQTQAANAWKDPTWKTLSSRNAEQFTQAYRLYTLAVGGKAALGAMNRFKEIKDLNKNALLSLAAAYAVSGNQKIAQDLFNEFMQSTNSTINHYSSYGSAIRDKAMLLELLTVLDKKDMGMELLKEIAQDFSADKWMSTQTSAYGLMACSKFIIKNQLKKEIYVEILVNGKVFKRLQQNSAVAQIPLNLKEGSSNEITIHNLSSNLVFAKILKTGIPINANEVATQNNLLMRVNYYDLAGKAIAVDNIQQGQDILVDVSITHNSVLGDYRHLALTQIFPSSWEIRNMRMEEENQSNTTPFEYQDIRDDRVLTYFSLKNGATKRFKILVNASYLGEFYLPATYVEEMYNNEIQALVPGKKIKVSLK